MSSASFDASFAWLAGVLISLACSVLVVLGASDLGWPLRLLLGTSLAVDWLILGLLCPGRRTASTASQSLG